MEKIRQYQTLNKRLTEMLEECISDISDTIYSDRYDKQTLKNLVQIARATTNAIADNNTAIMWEYRKNS